jgi:hypothetical protein
VLASSFSVALNISSLVDSKLLLSERILFETCCIVIPGIS